MGGVRDGRVATSDVVKLMRQQASPEFVGNFWSAFFPGQIPDRLVIAEELKRNVIELEGHDLVVVGVGHTDTDYTTCLHVPSVGLVVAGDRRLRKSSPNARIRCSAWWTTATAR